MDAETHTYIEEVGAANFFCVKDKVLYTPELTGTILPGITRMSIIELARSRGYKVVEEKVSAEFAMAADEAFCCGTAAVISPIASITKGETRQPMVTEHLNRLQLSYTKHSPVFRIKLQRIISLGFILCQKASEFRYHRHSQLAALPSFTHEKPLKPALHDFRMADTLP